MTILEIDAAGWVAIITAITTAAGGIAAAAVLVITAIGNMNKKLDAAAVRREDLAEAILDPAVTTLPPPEVKP